MKLTHKDRVHVVTLAGLFAGGIVEVAGRRVGVPGSIRWAAAVAAAAAVMIPLIRWARSALDRNSDST